MNKCSRCNSYMQSDSTYRTCEPCREGKRKYRESHKPEIADYMVEYRARKSQVRDMAMWRHAFSLGAGLLQ